MPRIYGNLERPKRDLTRFWQFLRRLIWAAAIIMVIYLLTWSRIFTVKEVEVQGTKLTDPTHLKGLVPIGSRIWWLPEEQITAAIADDPIIMNIKILRGLPNKVRIVVTEKEPTLLWQSGEIVSILDPNGMVITQYPASSVLSEESVLGQAVASLPVVVDTQQVPVQPGTAATSANFLEFMQKVRDSIETRLPDLTWQRIEVGESFLYDVTFVSSTGMSVSLNTLADADIQIKNLAFLIQHGAVGESDKVDLRVDRWAYVKSP